MLVLFSNSASNFNLWARIEGNWRGVSLGGVTAFSDNTIDPAGVCPQVYSRLPFVVSNFLNDNLPFTLG